MSKTSSKRYSSEIDKNSINPSKLKLSSYGLSLTSPVYKY